MSLTMQELVSILDTVSSVLKANKEYVSATLIDEVASLIESVKPVVAGNYQHLFDALGDVLSLERKLVSTSLTDDIIKACQQIKSHPVITDVILRLI